MCAIKIEKWKDLKGFKTEIIRVSGTQTALTDALDNITENRVIKAIIRNALDEISQKISEEKSRST